MSPPRLHRVLKPLATSHYGNSCHISTGPYADPRNIFINFDSKGAIELVPES